MKVDYSWLQQQFAITLPKDTATDAPESLTFRELCDPARMSGLLHTYAESIKADSQAPAATFLSGWLRTFALGFQYGLSVYNSAFSVKAEQTRLQVIRDEQSGRIRFEFVLANGELLDAPVHPQERAEWREAAVRGLYSECLKPVFDCISSVSELPAGQLWGQLPGAFYNQTASWCSALEDEAAVVGRIRDDFAFLKELEPDLFGLKHNPFHAKLTFVEDMKDPGKTVALKSSCCLFYRTDGGYYCYTCPRMNEEERKQRRTEARQAVSQYLNTSAAGHIR
ncbi:(2Fe-2S)-binding protein [Paenibacillus turpanensis]|uniref:(2Fe-2S)-binding protein n=1 Tax=Paenibacillus turpanensis TaxID=2689078 RepID=UPI00140E904E|nr:(2Fe-2S)-binding protein [Paenibacillus turpanensis]